MKHTCVVDENVDALELVTYAVYHLFDGAGIVEVTVVDERLLAVRLDIVGDRLCALFVAIVVDDNVVVFSEFTWRSTSDTTAGPGDECRGCHRTDLVYRL